MSELEKKIEALSESMNAVRNATLASAQASGQVVQELKHFRGTLQGSPNPLARLTAARTRHDVATLIVVVCLSALVGSVVALVWVAV